MPALATLEGVVARIASLLVSTGALQFTRYLPTHCLNTALGAREHCYCHFTDKTLRLRSPASLQPPWDGDYPKCTLSIACSLGGWVESGCRGRSLSLVVPPCLRLPLGGFQKELNCRVSERGRGLRAAVTPRSALIP